MFLYLELTFGIKITDPATDSGTETYELRTHHFSRAGVGRRGGEVWIHKNQPTNWEADLDPHPTAKNTISTQNKGNDKILKVKLYPGGVLDPHIGGYVCTCMNEHDIFQED